MAKAGDTLTNAMTGMKLRFLRTSADTNGALLEMEATYVPDSPEPPEHFHPQQEERFEVLDGEMQVRLPDGLRTLAKGDTLVVPPGLRHSMWNAGASPARVRWETRPPLRTEFFFEEIFALAAERRANPQGVPRLRDLAVLMPKYANEIQVTRPSRVVQKTVFGLARLFGR